MKLTYLVATLLFLCGLGLIIQATGSGDEVNLFGLLIHTRITKGLGVIVMIFSVVAFLAIYGGMSETLSRQEPRT
jgi:formate hydrogenlyase subunit 3/multisubunit Na+/H+ antiporter MnhD subunit